MYGILSEGEPFKLFARRESVGSGLMIRFECKEGMGVLGIRKPGRTDPQPVAAYEEEDIDPASLRAGRFVHVLPSGQRQSYALSRISAEVASRMPTDRWVELKPHTEYGFRYLVAPESELDSTVAQVAIGAPGRAEPVPVEPLNLAPDRAPSPVPPPVRPAPVATVSGPNAAVNGPGSATNPGLPREPLPALQTPMSPAIAEAALRSMSKEQAVELLKAEMNKVHLLQQRVAELDEGLRRAKVRERDLLDLLSRWSSES